MHSIENYQFYEAIKRRALKGFQYLTKGLQKEDTVQEAFIGRSNLVSIDADYYFAIYDSKNNEKIAVGIEAKDFFGEEKKEADSLFEDVLQNAVKTKKTVSNLFKGMTKDISLLHL